MENVDAEVREGAVARIPASVSNVTRTYRLGLLAVSIFGAKR